MAGPKQARAAGSRSGSAGGASKKSAQNKAAQNKNRPAGPAAGQALAKPAQSSVVPARQGQARTPQTRKARDRARARELAEQRAGAEPEDLGPPKWLQYTSLALAVFGLGMSTYLTVVHYTSVANLACSDNGLVNCGAVTTSPESVVFGVFPVAVLGLAFYIFMVAATTPMAWRSRRREIALARLGSVIVGVGFILYLIYAELFQVGFICLECTSVHVATFLLFVLISIATAVWGLPGGDSRNSG